MDEREGFLSDLRALRARRGFTLAEIAERTRFPADMLAAVESGPALPSLPALEAYLRGCGEPLARWEDRWRRLGQGAAGATSGAGLPVREAGASPLAAAGAAAAEAVTAPAGQAAFTIKRLGTSAGRGPRRAVSRRPRAASRRRVPARGYAAASVGAAALLAAGGVTLLALSQPAGHRPAAAPGATGGHGRPAQGTAPARGTPARHRPGGGQVTARLEVTGVGCPQDASAGVIVTDATAGPGWTAADGGWTGNGCDGSTVWTMDPNGNQPAPSALTWKFSLAAGQSHCALAVFVPAHNALGVGDYAVFAGDAADIATVPVSQAATAGRWVSLGSYPVRGTALEIQVVPAAGPAGDPGPGARGRNHVAGLGPGHDSAIAASAASAACS